MVTPHHHHNARTHKQTRFRDEKKFLETPPHSAGSFEWKQHGETRLPSCPGGTRWRARSLCWPTRNLRLSASPGFVTPRDLKRASCSRRGIPSASGVPNFEKQKNTIDWLLCVAGLSSGMEKKCRALGLHHNQHHHLTDGQMRLLQMRYG